MTFRVSRRYAPRPAAFHGVLPYEGWRMKRYTLTAPGETFQAARLATGRGLALSAVPEPAIAAARPGVGFVIEHQRQESDLVVVAWWDAEDELALRLVICDEAGWRTARPSESLSVWDLAVIAFERDAYVEAVLAPERPDLEAYLARVPPGATAG